jgi:hypothetical protein
MARGRFEDTATLLPDTGCHRQSTTRRRPRERPVRGRSDLARQRHLPPRQQRQPGEHGVGEHRGRQRPREELQRTARVPVRPQAGTQQIDGKELVEHQVRQEAEHRAAGQHEAGRLIRSVVEQVDDEPGDEHGRDTVKHAPVDREAVEHLAQAVADEEIQTAGQDDALLQRVAVLRQRPQHQEGRGRRRQAEHFTLGHAAVAVQVRQEPAESRQAATQDGRSPPQLQRPGGQAAHAGAQEGGDRQVSAVAGHRRRPYSG